MLTKTDLTKIQKIVKTKVREETRTIVQDETYKIVQSEARKIIKEELTPVKENITQIRKDIKRESWFRGENIQGVVQIKST